MAGKRLVASVREEERWLRLWGLSVSLQRLEAALGGASILGVPHSAGGSGAAGSHRVCWQTSPTSTESGARPPGSWSVIFHP